MKYISLFSGIEAASVAWQDLGWTPVGFSEIERFPCAVLDHHYPDVHNFGDVTKFKEWNINEQIDLIVGGSPCQSFSIAGLRKGLEDPRGNLMLVFLSAVDKFKPKWVVWENVPGVLSSNGGRDFGTFLGALADLHYIVDVDILDAQYFGLPQRRKRVYVCAQYLDDLLKQNTILSSLTITQCLTEILHGLLIEAFPESARSQANSASVKISKDGIVKRIELFKMLGEEGHWQMLQQNLTGALARCQSGVKSSAGKDGAGVVEHIADDLLMGLKTGLLFSLTEESLKKSLDDVYEVMKLFTTSTSIKVTTTYQILLFKAVLNIAKLTLLLSGSSLNSSESESSNLTTLQEYMNYARKNSGEIPKKSLWLCAWNYLIREAEHTSKTWECLGNARRAAKVLFESESVCRNPASSRSEGQAATPFTESSFGNYSQGVGTLRASGGSLGGGSETLVTAPHGATDPVPSTKVFSPVGRNAGQETCVAIQGNLIGRDKGGPNGVGANEDGSMYTLTKTDVHAVAFAQNKEGGACAVNNVRVRKLMPVECERLQGFPDNHTNIPYKGKEAPDTQRYKALGNSMAVPVMRWIGQRIDKESKND